MKNKFKIEFSAVSENEAFARMCISAFLMPSDPTVNEMMDIKTAVSEAVTNAIIHGYENAPDGVVSMSARLEDDTVYIEISDKGRGIEDIETARKPLFTTSPECERSGMGFTIMEAFTDKIIVESQMGEGTKVIMTKKLRR